MEEVRIHLRELIVRSYYYIPVVGSNDAELRSISAHIPFALYLVS